MYVLVTDFGDFVVPPAVLNATRFTKAGWPDKRTDATVFWNRYNTLKQAA